MSVDNSMPQFEPLTWTDAVYLTPEWILAAAFVLLIILDLALPRRMGRNVIGWLTLAGFAASLGAVLWRLAEMSAGALGEAPEIIRLLGDSYRIDQFASILKLILLAAAILIVLMSLGTVRREEIPHKSEFYYLMLPAVLGAMMMASSGDLVTLYLGLEVMSVTTYVLVAMRKHAAQSAEGAFKYVVTGGISSALILFGMSYLYGLTGTTNLGRMAGMLQMAGAELQELLYVAVFMLVAGLGIKIAAAPFHTWAPDVYQGAPTPVTAFLAIVSKAAVFAVLFRIIYNLAFALSASENPVGGDIFLLLLILAAAAMLVGTTAALKQRNVKRLMALSGVANAGYLLVPIGVSIKGAHMANFGEFAFYLIAYVLMNVGAFAVISIVQAAAGHEEVKGFSGLYYRAPWTAAAMIVFILSLAGLPISGGFFGKLFILLGAAQSHAYWIVAIMVISSVISYYFYFAIIRQMFMRGTGEESEIRVPVTTGVVIWVSAVLTVALGIVPGWLAGWLNDHFSLLTDLMIRY
ncbi:NADH-quinone oxidoreductase subunit N [Paenibacillus sp. GCM10027626]|uniref:NADH-quinone oxidoreductase subunit N n=1 Tax=Paenibacillus sp. GCM10027626 TaxID=3273411 RepID=UPI003632D604